MKEPPSPVNWDYRCPFARNAHEHLVTALEAGAPFEVSFVPFSLNQAHVEADGRSVWDDPEHESDLLAGQVGIVVRDRFPEKFLRTHLALFALRHDDSGDLREQAALASVLERQGLASEPGLRRDQERVAARRVPQVARIAAVADYAVFGVPTFVAGGQAAFVRIMTRPGEDAGIGNRDDRPSPRSSPASPRIERVQAHLNPQLNVRGPPLLGSAACG